MQTEGSSKIMCAIVGILNRDGEPVCPELTRQMADSLAHRGPDGEGLAVRGRVAFGHRRLSIIDPKGGRQPMFNEDGNVWVTYNGEIYNYRELTNELKGLGHQFRSQSDTETIVHAWEQWGESCVERFRGMFAFAIMDWRRNLLFLARDQFGIKPLYYVETPRHFGFASELQALRMVPGFTGEFDFDSLDQYLWLQYVPAPRSIFTQVQKLPPAHWLTVDLEGRVSRPREYWRLKFAPEQGRSMEEWTEAADAVIGESVRAHLVSDVPFGSFLSGGVDSSLVVARMSRELGQPVSAFSIGFEEPEFNETAYAAEAAKSCGATHYTEIVQPDALGVLSKLVRHYGEPFGDSSAVPTYYLSQLARRHVPMVLSGDGADELFAGYRSHGFFMAEFADRPGVEPEVSDWLRFIHYADLPTRLALWRPEFRSRCSASLEIFGREWEQARGLGLGHKVQHMDIKTYLPFAILPKVDIASMMHGLEVRTPFVDVRVAELAAKIPDRLNFERTSENGWRGKRILRRVAAKYFGEDFLARPKKGFAMPLAKWFAPGGRLHEAVARRLLGPESALHEFYEPAPIRELLSKGVYGTLWLLLFLEEWLRYQKSAPMWKPLAAAEINTISAANIREVAAPVNETKPTLGTPLHAKASALEPAPMSRSLPPKRPRILFLADRPGWAFDINARGISEALGDEFEFRIEYVVQQPDLGSIDYELLVVMFWGETYHERFSPDPRKVIKQISSHRWALEPQYGMLKPAQMAERYLRNVAAVLVPSQRLQREFAPFKPTFLAPKGFSPGLLGSQDRDAGPLSIGWVGNRNDPCKGLNDILLPAMGRDFQLNVAGGDLNAGEMKAFYNSIDVLCVASTAEGDPRPLIEGMASGCFPIAVDVGIVPELVTHGENGFIVNRKVEAFQAALQWCQCNLDHVRDTGRNNAAWLPEVRSWQMVAPKWRDAFRAVLNRLPATTAMFGAQVGIPTMSPEARSTMVARAFESGYALADWEPNQSTLQATFRVATGSPHAPPGYTDAVTHALGALNQHHQVIIDIGAWLGNFALNAAVLNRAATIFALEPEPAHFSFLTRRAPANVVPLRLAVGSECGRTDIFLSSNSQGHTLYHALLNPTHGRTVPVRTITFAQLIEMAGGKADFLKINAEGAEYDILSSAAFRNVGEAIVEIHLEGGQDGLGLLAAVRATHNVKIIEDRSPRFLFAHLCRKTTD